MLEENQPYGSEEPLRIMLVLIRFETNIYAVGVGAKSVGCHVRLSESTGKSITSSAIDESTGSVRTIDSFANSTW